MGGVNPRYSHILKVDTIDKTKHRYLGPWIPRARYEEFQLAGKPTLFSIGKNICFFFGRFPCFRLDFFSTQSFDVLDFPMRCFNVVACREGLIADIEPHVFREETGNPEKK